MENIAFVDGTLKFDLSTAGIKVELTLDDEGKQFKGILHQAGLEMPLMLRHGDTDEKAKEAIARARKRLEGFEEWIEEAREAWHVPGLGVAIVVHDEVVLSRGFGLRNVEENLPVTEKTLFAIGSTSKAFTCMDIALLAKDGKLAWDTPVREYLSGFELQDPFATAQMTARDLVTHRSGLPRHDMMWYGSDFTRKEMFERLRYLEPTKPFRTTFQYQNLMYMTAGYLVGQVAGSTWEEVTRERIFKPLGMNGSNFSVIDSQKTDDYSLPYSYDPDEDKLEAIDFRNIDEIGPAGSINSNLNDMTQWLRFHLNDGLVGDEALVGPEVIAQMHTPFMAQSAPATDPNNLSRGYGLGWGISVFRGHHRVHHGGGIDGFITEVTLLPHQEVGMVILSNLSGQGLPGAVAQHAMDRLLDLEPIDWNKQTLARLETARKAVKKTQDEAEEKRVADAKPSHSLDSYAGKYEHPGYGEVVIAMGTGSLSIDFNGLEGAMEPWHFETFRVKEGVGEGTMVTFATGEDGKVASLSIELEAAVDPIVFERMETAKDKESGAVKGS